MGKETTQRVVKAAGSIVAMVLIWRLVESALAAGINGMIFFGGMAAIAGLGGYEIREIVNTLRSKNQSDKKSK